MSSESEDENFLSADEGDSDVENSSNIEETKKVEQHDFTKGLEEKISTEVKPLGLGLAEETTTDCKEKSSKTPHLQDKTHDHFPKSESDADYLVLHEDITDGNAFKVVETSEDVAIAESGVTNLKLSKSSDSLSEEVLSETRQAEFKELEDVRNRNMSQDSQDIIVAPKSLEIENEIEKLQDITKNSDEISQEEKTKAKPIKESKIKLKKPREKLGERLGSKKLGARTTKPLEGISSDSVQTREEENVIAQSSLKEKSQTVMPDTSLQNANEESGGWGSWGDWGSSLVTAASTLSKEVSRGMETVLEAGIGAPDPMELAKEAVAREKSWRQVSSDLCERETEEKPQVGMKMAPSPTEKITPAHDNPTDEEPPGLGFGLGTLGFLVTGVSGALETASNKVLLGGLDTLEKIGRRTMDILQEGDPGLRKKRNFLCADKPNLSLALREARERALAEEEERKRCEDSGADGGSREVEVKLSLAWDNTEGPAHLEALSLVSKQCQTKTCSLLHDLPAIWIQRIQQKLDLIREMSTTGEEERSDDVEQALMEVTRDIQLPLQFNRVLTGWPALQESLSKLSIEICGLGSSDFVSIQTDLYREMTKYVAQVVGIVHKGAEVALISPDAQVDNLASQFQRLCGYVSSGLEKAADDVCESISKVLPGSDPEFNAVITNVYVQMAELNSYLDQSLANINHVFVYVKAKMMAREFGE